MLEKLTNSREGKRRMRYGLFQNLKKEPKNLAKKPQQRRNVYQKPEVENLKKQNTKKSETEIRSFLATATHNEPHEWVGP